MIGTEPQRKRRLPTALLAVAVVFAGALFAGNNVAERHELDRLLARVDAAQDTIAYSNHRVQATVDYTRPLLFGANVPADVRAGLQQLVAESAAGQVGSVEHERATAAAVSVLPWHRGMRRAKAALVTYLAARASYLRGVAANSRTLYVEHPELDVLLDRTRAAFRAAGGGAEVKRVDAAFAGGTHPA
ncbi:MAG: hypothetical protein QOE05_3342 [Actinomycetota bacterium]|nr:hypothetical protein [Actinomycetota bacterium]